jgi:hypothetical protein
MRRSALSPHPPVTKDPRVVGGRYYCGYWRMEYTVLKFEGYRITCRQETLIDYHNVPESDYNRIGRVWSHSTAWNSMMDRVVSIPTKSRREK